MDFKQRNKLDDEIRNRLQSVGWRYEYKYNRYYAIYDNEGIERGYSRHTLNGAWMDCKKSVEAIEVKTKATAAMNAWNAKVKG